MYFFSLGKGKQCQLQNRNKTESGTDGKELLIRKEEDDETTSQKRLDTESTDWTAE